MTRTLIYGIIALVIVIAAALIAFVFTNPSDTPTQGGEQRGFFESLFPFDFSVPDQPLFGGDGGTPTDSAPQAAPVLRKVSEDPVSGGFAFERNGQTVIRFINRATGHVYETVATSTAVERITNTTVPGIQEAIWIDANNFIVRYLNGDDPETFLVRLSANAEGEQRLDGLFLESYARAALDPGRKSLLSVLTNTTGASVVLSEPDGSDAREVLASPIASWVPLQSENQIFVYTAPLSGFSGHLYQISGGGLVKVIGNIPGLEAQVSPSGEYALISSGDGSEVNLFLVAIETGEVYESPVNTLAEKCVFDTEDETRVYCGVPTSFGDAAYPNDWLLGRVSFSDTLWSILFTTERATLVSDLKDAGGPIDVVQSMLNPEGTHLLFTNKNDLSLWSLQVRTPKTDAN